MENQPIPVQQEIDLTLDPMGRALDQNSGKYLRLLRSEWAPPGLNSVKLGGYEGEFLTIDSEGDLVPWESPANYCLN